ncbi:hypothetical protein [Salibacter sp.]|uniref:hypothetical protein n=1 Tax=Salibacter sp. TaxID=2010995 RepID=UPI00286FDD0F|nr:hypothetical protein [Salibacter sp.]MDR9398180.1 hypothetical protein [Salibacter sp.]MDR9487041.1 hypothetical protein [Salibacter sp.]
MIKSAFIFLLTLSLFSCSSKTNSTHFKPEIKVLSDSTILFNKNLIKIDRLEDKLNLHTRKYGDVNHVIVEAERNQDMSIIEEIQRLLAADSVNTITYVLEGDSSTASLIDASNLTTLKLHKDGIVSVDGQKAKSNTAIQNLIQQSINNNKDQVIELSIDTGVGYDMYIAKKHELQTVVSRIDSSLYIEEESFQYYR